MSTRNLRNSLTTVFSHFVQVVGFPVHYFAHGVDLGFALLIVLSVLHPTHEFELSIAGLTLANMVLGLLLEEHHRTQQN